MLRDFFFSETQQDIKIIQLNTIYIYIYFVGELQRTHYAEIKYNSQNYINNVHLT